MSLFSACQEDIPVVIQFSSTQSSTLSIQVSCVSGIELPHGALKDDRFPVIVLRVCMAGEDFIDGKLGIICLTL